MRHCIILPMVCLVLAVALLQNAQAFWPGSGKAAREVIEEVAHKCSIELGESAGKQFAKRAKKFLLTHGEEGAKAMLKVGSEIMDKTAVMGDDLIAMCAAQTDDAARFLFAHADKTLPVWRTYGKAGTDMLLKHPDMGTELLSRFGRDGLEAGLRLKPVQVQKLLALATKVAKAEKEPLLDAILKGGDNVLDFLWKHKAKLAAGVGVYALLQAHEQENVSTAPDGSQLTSRTRGSMAGQFIKHLADSLLGYFPWLGPMSYALVCLLIGLFVWPFVKVGRRAAAYLEMIIHQRTLAHKKTVGEHNVPNRRNHPHRYAKRRQNP